MILPFNIKYCMNLCLYSAVVVILVIMGYFLLETRVIIEIQSHPCCSICDQSKKEWGEKNCKQNQNCWFKKLSFSTEQGNFRQNFTNWSLWRTSILLNLYGCQDVRCKLNFLQKTLKMHLWHTVKSRVEARVTIQEIKSMGVLQTKTCH